MNSVRLTVKVKFPPCVTLYGVLSCFAQLFIWFHIVAPLALRLRHRYRHRSWGSGGEKRCLLYGNSKQEGKTGAHEGFLTAVPFLALLSEIWKTALQRISLVQIFYINPRNPGMQVSVVLLRGEGMFWLIFLFLCDTPATLLLLGTGDISNDLQARNKLSSN